MANTSKRLLLFTAKMGYQTRSFEDAARKLDVQLVYVTDRCHQLEDPWGDQAIAVHFESAKTGFFAHVGALRGRAGRGSSASGPPPRRAAVSPRGGGGIPYHPPWGGEGRPQQAAHKTFLRRGGIRCPVFPHSSRRSN